MLLGPGKSVKPGELILFPILFSHTRYTVVLLPRCGVADDDDKLNALTYNWMNRHLSPT